jgi:Ser/Thr protein kinase RdoA (MazF antagonist)
VVEEDVGLLASPNQQNDHEGMFMSGVEAVAKALAVAYGWPDAVLQRLPSGTATVNYAGQADGRQIFVKVYPPGTDLDTERSAIELSQFAAASGVPTAAAIRSLDGSLIHRSDETGFSAWEFVLGDPVGESGLTERQMAAVGGSLGRLHRVLAEHPAAPSTVEPASALCDVDRSIGKIDKVLTALSHKPNRDDFQAWALDVLRWRLAQMPRIAEILAGLPPLTCQILHGDFAAPNVLFCNDQVAAVIDFRPPRARPVAWEISRIGCDPRTVLRSEEWQRGMRLLAAAYRAEHGHARPDDLVATVRAWVCYSATSIYPFDELVMGEPLLADSLKTYARDRQQALVMVMNDLASVEEGLRATLG